MGNPMGFLIRIDNDNACYNPIKHIKLMGQFYTEMNIFMEVLYNIFQSSKNVLTS